MPRRGSALSMGTSLAEVSVAEPNLLVQQVRSLLAEAQALSARLAALNEVAVAVQSSLDTEAVLHTFAREARWVLDFQVCSIALREQHGYSERVLAPGRGVTSIIQHPLAEGAIGRVLAQGQALLLSSLAPEDAAPAGMRSGIILPLRNGEHVIGTLNFYATAQHQYDIDDLRIAYALAVQIAVVFQNTRLYTEVTRARDELNTMLESIGDAVLVVDLSGRVLLLNSQLRRLLGLGHGLYHGQRALKLVHNIGKQHKPLLSPEAIRAWLKELSQGGQGIVQFSDGRHIEWACTPLVSTEAIAGFVITARDASARIELEQLRDDMIGMLVHDLRTPLTGLIMGLDLMRMYTSTTETADYEAVYRQTRGSADRLLHHINAILDMRKIEASRFELALGRCSLRMLAQHALEPLRPLLERTEQHVSFDFSPDVPVVIADAGLLQRVFENLLGNAQKFTPIGGQIRLGARMLPEQGMVECFVQDNGPGIASELHEHIFDKYGQVSGEKARKGTGLGLYFCRLVVEAHNGSIGVRHAPGGGSIFWFTLPIP